LQKHSRQDDFVKPTGSNPWRWLRDEHVLFYSYRWLAWVLACLTVALQPPERQPLYAWLLVMTGLVNIVATTLVHPYLRLARRRPFILALDVVFSMAVVWLSGGYLLPFFPYALGSLALPARVRGWRSALVAGLSFVALDQVILLSASTPPVADPLMPSLLTRSLAPLAFGLMWSAVPQILSWRHRQMQTPEPGSHVPAASPDRDQTGRDRQGAGFQSRADRDSTGDANRDPLPDAPALVPLTAVRATEHEVQGMRRALYALTPGLDTDLATALNQLASSFSRQSDVTVRMSRVGPTLPLTAAQHVTLLKLAQEALLNVQQHAHAQSAQLILRYEPHAITLTIQDDGVGLLDGTHERPGVHALRAMRYRLAELDGNLEVAEGEHGGVTVRGTLPLDDQ
jgi:two-component sensor histidine kinase